MIAAGAKQGEIASALGVSTRQVKRYRQDTGVQDRIAALVEKHEGKIDTLFEEMLGQIGAGFKAQTVYAGKERKGVPDHKARQTAVQNMLKLAATLRPKVDKKVRRGLTYSEMVDKYNEFIERTGAGEDPLIGEPVASEHLM